MYDVLKMSPVKMTKAWQTSNRFVSSAIRSDRRGDVSFNPHAHRNWWDGFSEPWARLLVYNWARGKVQGHFSETDADMIGRSISRYETIDKLGEVGTGTPAGPKLRS